MNYFLLKTDPDTYSISDFKKEGETIWDGVHNFQAINFIKQMKIGDKAYIYHSQTDKSIVGIAEVIGAPFENKNNSRKSWAVKLKLEKIYSKTVTLADIKNNGGFEDFLLIRNGRLSVMSVPENVQKFLEKRLE
jgi:predicted RNA-binding protein with PUA-like domain